MKTFSFLAGFFRFIARRGCPTKIFSDNGTNLVSACNELSRCLRNLNRGSIISSARSRGMDWKFNPPLASRQSGVWERMIRTVRRVLCTLLDRKRRLTNDILHIVMCDAEKLFNSRPITTLSDDPDDEEPLTPNNLRLLHANSFLTLATFFSSDLYRERWRYSQ